MAWKAASVPTALTLLFVLQLLGMPGFEPMGSDLILAPVQADAAAIAKAACGVDPPVVQRSAQVADCEARAVSSFAVHVDRHFTRLRDLTPKINRDTANAAGPLARYLIAQNDGLRLETMSRFGRTPGAVADLPAIEPTRIFSGTGVAAVGGRRSRSGCGETCAGTATAANAPASACF